MSDAHGCVICVCAVAKQADGYIGGAWLHLGVYRKHTCGLMGDICLGHTGRGFHLWLLSVLLRCKVRAAAEVSAQVRRAHCVATAGRAQQASRGLQDQQWVG